MAQIMAGNYMQSQFALVAQTCGLMRMLPDCRQELSLPLKIPPDNGPNSKPFQHTIIYHNASI